MGQIIGGAAKPKRCNLNQLYQLGTPAAGEYILVSSDNSMNAAGQGNFDCYIVGNGRTAATALEVKPINKLESEVYKKREYGTITGKYISGTAWNNLSGAVSRYIRVKIGDVVHIVKNSTKNGYVAFLTSVNTSESPVFTNGTSSVQKKITDSTFQVVTDCYLWWLIDYNASQRFEPSVLTLNDVDILTSTYSINKLAEMEGRIENLEDNVGDIDDNLEPLERDVDSLKRGFAKMVGQYQPNETVAADWGEVVSQKYWNLVDGSAGLVAIANYDYDYFARPTLYPVVPSMKMVVTIKDIYVGSLSNAAFSGYDNDGLPAYDNGTVARQNFSTATNIVDNGDGTKTYTFILGSSVTQVGLFYKGEEVTFYFEQNEILSYSQTLDTHIQEVAGGGMTTAGDSAKYFLKGESPKTFSKKICILAAGQSNIDGRDDYADMPEEIKSAQPIANCLYVKNNESGTFAPINIEGQWAFDLVTYYNISLHQDLYVIKWSAGGTSIDPLGDSSYHWTADYEDLDSLSKSLLLKFETEIRNHIASDGSQFDVRAMLWHQGEGDRGSLGTGSADRYYNNLRNMVSYIRGVVGNERLPIITGTISENSAQYDATIHSAQEQLASEDPYFILIDMSGAPLKDSYHFNAAASVYLGQMAYNALIDLGVISATKLTPTRPW